MINSDNVVRGGLTPKLKDVENLIKMLPYNFEQNTISSGQELLQSPASSFKEYKTGYTEFRVFKL